MKVENLSCPRGVAFQDLTENQREDIIIFAPLLTPEELAQLPKQPQSDQVAVRISSELINNLAIDLD